MKTPQIEHGVLDPKTGKEITTPLGIPRSADYNEHDYCLNCGAKIHGDNATGCHSYCGD